MSDMRDNLEGNVGNIITVHGKISQVMWQHFTANIDSHPNMIYFDLEDGYQIIVYSRDEIVCNGRIQITGKVVELESDYNNPKTKIHDKFSEYHIVADSWKCNE
ncbi:MAG: hypothetical protein ACTSWY_04250 [Promethearchaeota archaeon]